MKWGISPPLIEKIGKALKLSAVRLICRLDNIRATVVLKFVAQLKGCFVMFKDQASTFLLTEQLDVRMSD